MCESRNQTCLKSQNSQLMFCACADIKLRYTAYFSTDFTENLVTGRPNNLGLNAIVDLCPSVEL